MTTTLPNVGTVFGTDFVTNLQTLISNFFKDFAPVILAVIGTIAVIVALNYVIRFIRSKLSK